MTLSETISSPLRKNYSPNPFFTGTLHSIILNHLPKKSIFLRLLKNAQMQGARNPEAYLDVRCNDEG
jgi:hypothetical protein